MWSATYNVYVGQQKWKQHKKLQQDGWKYKNKHGAQPYGCKLITKIRHWKSRGFWSKQKWPKWRAWIAYKFPRGIYFERLECSNSQPLQPKHKALSLVSSYNFVRSFWKHCITDYLRHQFDFFTLMSFKFLYSYISPKFRVKIILNL